MTVRWNAGDPRGVPSGYNGSDIPGDVNVPSCGIEDVDVGVFELFNVEIGFQVITKEGGTKTVRKANVFFGSGEKWATIKRHVEKRDKQGTLILPLISIRRLGIQQQRENDQLGRGINQATGELVFRRRLGQRDREYQNLVNKLGLKNQSNVPESRESLPVGTLREIGENVRDEDVQKGALLNPKLGRNIWEILTIPSPQFYTATYEVTFWTQYVTHMNEMVERLMAAYLPQLPALKITTKQGYWFVGYIDGEYRPEDNIDDMGESERLLKYTFTMRVPAYTVAPKLSGMQSPVRRYYSAPEVSFGVSEESTTVRGASDQREVPLIDGADDPTLGYTLSGEVQPKPAATREKFYAKVTKNPFTNKERASYVRIVSVNSRSGETVFRPIGPGIEIEIE